MYNLKSRTDVCLIIPIARCNITNLCFIKLLELENNILNALNIKMSLNAPMFKMINKVGLVKPLTTIQIRSLIDASCISLNLPHFKLHSFRIGAISLIATFPELKPIDVSNFARHSHRNVTEHYQKVDIWKKLFWTRLIIDYVSRKLVLFNIPRTYNNIPGNHKSL